ncbi:MAG: haloacid dehalogenase type II [Burkholderiales bacterium]
MNEEKLRDRVTVLMFDLYGTIVDMQGGLTEAVTPYLKTKGWNGRPDALVTWWRRTHFENSMIDALLHRDHTPYREIGSRALSYTLERAGIAHTQDEVRRLVACIETLRPFPDVVEALQALGKRYRLTILSNGDPDMLESARPRLGVAFDRIMSVAEAASFKPHVATYAKAVELLGVGREEVLFVANHAFDCIGAKGFGMHTCFVDRRQRPFGAGPYQPDLIVADFAELAQRLG